MGCSRSAGLDPAQKLARMPAIGARQPPMLQFSTEHRLEMLSEQAAARSDVHRGRDRLASQQTQVPQRTHEAYVSGQMNIATLPRVEGRADTASSPGRPVQPWPADTELWSGPNHFSISYRLASPARPTSAFERFRCNSSMANSY